MHVSGSRKRKKYYTGSQTPFNGQSRKSLLPTACRFYRFRLFCRSLKTNSLLILVHRSQLWAWQQDPAFAGPNLIFSLCNFENGKVWVLLVPLFVHANLLHRGDNMLSFWKDARGEPRPEKLLARSANIDEKS